MLKYCESFDHVTAAALMALGWNTDTNRQIVAGAGRWGTSLLELNVNGTYSPNVASFTLARSCDRIVVGFALLPKANYYGDKTFYVQFLYGTYENFRVRVVPTTSGLTFQFWTGEGTGYPLIASSAYISAPFIQSAFTFIEILVDVTDYTNGQVKCGVNGKVVHTATGIMTAAGTGFGNNPFDPRAKINRVQFNATLKLDSLYICDDDGGYHNDFLGDIFVKTIYPVGDGDRIDWSPYINGLAAPDNTPRVSLIDDPVFDPAVEPDYIQAEQDLAQETMSFGNTAIPVESTLIAVNHRTAARSDATPGTPPPNALIPLYKSSGNDTVVTNSLAKKFSGWAYQFLDVYYNLVPDLTVDWTKQILDESLFGFIFRESIWTGVLLDDIGIADEVMDE